MPTEIAVIKIERAITPWKIIKKGSIKDMTNFLQTSDKLSIKKKRQINKNKWKKSIRKTSSRKATINNLNNFDKIALLVFLAITKIFEFKAKNSDITMIDMNIYHITYCLKRTQVFAIPMKDI